MSINKIVEESKGANEENNDEAFSTKNLTKDDIDSLMKFCPFLFSDYKGYHCR